MPVTTNLAIKAAALLRRRNGNYYLIVRWHLGEQASDRLPRVSDKFAVTVKLGASDIADAEVAPRLYAMLAPPRTLEEMGPRTVNRRWEVYTTPTGPVRLVRWPNDHLPDTEAFGVFHLLDES